jgi:hypothetical protein
MRKEFLRQTEMRSIFSRVMYEVDNELHQAIRLRNVALPVCRPAAGVIGAPILYAALITHAGGPVTVVGSTEAQ